MQATGTATDTLGAIDTDVKTIAVSGATGVSTIRTSFFTNRAN